MEIATIQSVMASAKRVHLIGIGGVSMSSLAKILRQLGFAVSGSDKNDSAVIRSLREGGILVHLGHAAEHVQGADAVVYTAAIPDANPELMAAKEGGIPLLSRGELLGWLMLGYERRIGIAGTHGKSTTTSMTAMILMEAETDPTVLNGADFPQMGGSYRIGQRQYFLFEACEYKDSFLSFYPTTAVIGNVELDHTDYFSSVAQMESSFRRYLSVGSIGILNADDPACMRVMQGYAGKSVTFGVTNHADYRAEQLLLSGTGACFRLVVRGRTSGEITLHVPGRHNVYNALAACAAAMENGVAFEAVQRGLEKFQGARRRFDFRGRLNGAPVYDDYAHHPSEIRATLSAAKAMGKRVVCVFQPHTFARTYELFDGFVQALSLADRLYLADIYAAREANQWGITSQKLADAIPGASCPGDFGKIAQQLQKTVGSDDLVLIMGAGDVIQITGLLPLQKECE